MKTMHTITLTAAQHQALRVFLEDELDGHDENDMRDTFGAYHAVCHSTKTEVPDDAPTTLAEGLAILHGLEANDLGNVYRAYSGRGMFGRCCLAFSTPYPSDVIARSGIPGARTDSLGREAIVYWPAVKDEG
ncbi:MAG: hypothetical protein ACK4MG_04095 [Aquabacterium sp.]